MGYEKSLGTVDAKQALTYLKGAVACLEQNATYFADVRAARKWAGKATLMLASIINGGK